jgi:hypothetical protein
MQCDAGDPEQSSKLKSENEDLLMNDLLLLDTCNTRVNTVRRDINDGNFLPGCAATAV